MRFIAVIAGLLMLGACGAVPPFAILDGASVVGTDKTLGDHAISLYTGKNCATIRIDRGETYCEEDAVVPAQVIYCYKTLGSATCYDRPDPHRGRYQKLGGNDHNLAKKKN